MQDRAAGKIARLGRSAHRQTGQRRQNRLGYRQAAMHMQLGHIFARETVWRDEAQNQSLVQQLIICRVIEFAQSRHARFRQVFYPELRQRAIDLWAAQPNDRQGGTAGPRR